MNKQSLWTKYLASRSRTWRLWFAWHPVTVYCDSGDDVAFLQTVERMWVRGTNGTPAGYIYRWPRRPTSSGSVVRVT